MDIPSHFADAVHLGDEPEAAALVLADWLDEHGDPARARFVRLSVALAQDPHGPGAAAAARERDWLWRACGERWAAGVPDGVYLDERGFSDARWGVIEAVHVAAESLAKLGPRLFEESDARGVELSADWPPAGPADTLDAIGRDRIARLAMDAPIGREDQEAFLRQLLPWPPRLRSLELSFRSEAVESAWASVPPPRGLRELGVQGGDVLPEALACPEAWADLRELHLNWVDPRSPIAGVFPLLSRLDVELRTPWDIFAGPECVPNLRDLRVWFDQRMGDDYGRTLREWIDRLPLERLVANGVRPSAVLSPGLRVADLTLGGFESTTEERQALLEWPGLSGLRRLRLSEVELDAEFPADLARATRGGSLEQLEMHGLGSP